MKNALIWIVVFVAICLIAGKTPKSEHVWLIIETGALLFWCATGVMLFVRFLYRFVTTHAAGK
jgi:hypothetical protein